MGDLLSLIPRLGARKGLRRGTSARVWYERGCALEGPDPAAAMAAYRRALSAQADLADAHNNLGRLCHDEGDLAAAESRYRLALCADAGVALYWFNLGVAVEDQGRTGEALAAYREALALDGGLADAHYNVARLLERIGRAGNDLAMQGAVRHLTRYRKLTATVARGR